MNYVQKRDTGKSNYIYWYSVALTCCWPLTAEATGSQITRLRIYRSLVLLNAFLLFLPLIYSLYKNQNDHVIFCKTICLLLAVVQVLSYTTVCIVHRDCFQELITEMTECCVKAKTHERYIYQSYVDKYSRFYGVSAVWFYLTALIIATGTLFIPQPFPTTAEYPFPVNFQPIKSIIFFHQSFISIQCSAHVCINMLCALLMLFAAARFEILKMELSRVTNSREIIDCMKKYYIVTSYAKKVTSVVRFVALCTVISCGVVLVFCGVNFIEKQPSTVRLQFLSLVGTGLIEVFMVAWPADRLLDLSQNAMKGIYESKWYQQSTSMQKDMVILLVPQTPVAIKIMYIIPTLSLNYYCSFVSNVISFFTVLRAAIKNDKHNDSRHLADDN